MPELPEITVIAEQMNKQIAGKSILDVEVNQPKILNMPVSELVKTAKGKTVSDVSGKGKWLFIKLKPDFFILINLGMGADLVYFAPSQRLPEKYQFKLIFSDKSGFTIRFWWFGYVHLASEEGLREHKLTAQLGPSPLDEGFTLEYFKKLLAGKNTRIKSFLLDQRNIAGIGNVYIHDILFKAGLHPNRKISSLSDKEIHDLYKGIVSTLRLSIQLGGLAYERDFYGQKGRFTVDEFLVGYREGKPCPTCGTTIEKIKMGSTSSYICPKCQVLE